MKDILGFVCGIILLVALYTAFWRIWSTLVNAVIDGAKKLFSRLFKE